MNYLKNSYVEQDPNDWYKSVLLLITEIIGDSKIENLKIETIGVSSQLNALIDVDKNGNLLNKAILYLEKLNKIWR